jgi:NAD+ synthase
MTEAKKEYKHFKNQDTVYDLIEQIKNRHNRSYSQLIDEMISQIKNYFERAFVADTAPSRFGKVGSNQVRQRLLIGLSGGIDSSAVTYLAVNAVGKEAVLPVTMPARPDDDSVHFSALIRDALKFDEPDAPYFIDIEPIVQTHMSVMNGMVEKQVQLGTNHHEQSFEQKMRSGNFGSRVRIAVLSDLQRSIRGRILGTVNRTEFCQGYSTKFGTPVSYDFGVLNELYKIDIYEIAKLLGVPSIVLTTPPSTGYFAGQTHEGELGASIEEQDIFAYLLFERNMDPSQIADQYGGNEKFANIMKRRFEVSEHKRVMNKLQEHVRISQVPLQM